MALKKVLTQEVVEHHLESVFDIKPGTTLLEAESLESDVVDSDDYDEKDKTIDEQFQTIYDTALTAFADQAGLINNESDPKFSARGMEVANQFLTTALMAAKEQANLKMHKDNNKIKQHKITGNVTNNNLIMTREEFFSMMLERTKT
jgi:hypothetical protein